ncbi:MAG: class I SAM-dependent methyltransferase [Pararhodobacter sp.]
MDALYHDPALAGFYDADNPQAASDVACLGLAVGRRAVLDLGCGTGRLAVALAAGGAQVVGVDPAAAMLTIARARAGGDAVHWVQADARQLDLGRRFDLIVMTGHVFQVFLDAADRAAVLKGIAAHLAPGGLAVFDSRNPARAEWREWTPEQTEEIIDHAFHGPCRRWDEAAFDTATAICTYRTSYRRLRDGQLFSADARIAFPERPEIEAAIAGAGLRVQVLWGDWQRAPCTAQSPQIIPLVGLAQS